MYLSRIVPKKTILSFSFYHSTECTRHCWKEHGPAMAGFIILGVLLMTALSWAETIPVPSSQKSWTYSPVTAPLSSLNPLEILPIGVGSVANNGNTLSLQVDAGQFSGPVDIYFGVYAPSVDHDNILAFSSEGYR